MAVSLAGAIVERGHLLFGLVFLVLVIDETRRAVAPTCATGTGRLAQLVFVVAGFSMWVATIRADTVSDFFIHSLWADALLLIGGVEWAWRVGALSSRRWLFAKPAALAISGLLLFVHLHGAAGSPEARAHIWMGVALVVAGIWGAAVHLARSERGWAAFAQLPAAAFVLLLITYPQ